MRISDWSSDVCSSDLAEIVPALERRRNGVGLAGDAIELTEYAFDDEGETEGQQQTVKVVQLVEPTQQRSLQEDAEGADDEGSDDESEPVAQSGVSQDEPRDEGSHHVLRAVGEVDDVEQDRKSTRLNSSH